MNDEEGIFEVWLAKQAACLREFYERNHQPGRDDDIEIVSLLFWRPIPSIREPLIQRFCMLGEEHASSAYVDELIGQAQDDVMSRELSGTNVTVLGHGVLEKEEPQTGM